MKCEPSIVFEVVAKGEIIHNEPMPITAEMVLVAIKAADAEGRRRIGIYEKIFEVEQQ